MIIFSVGKRFKNFISLKIYGKSKNEQTSELKLMKPGDKDGIQKLFYKNGTIKAELRYKDGLLDGIATLYYESGNIKAREFYKLSQLQGLSKWYYESGELKSEKYFSEGILISTREFDKKGKIISTKI